MPTPARFSFRERGNGRGGELAEGEARASERGFHLHVANLARKGCCSADAIMLQLRNARVDRAVDDRPVQFGRGIIVDGETPSFAKRDCLSRWCNELKLPQSGRVAHAIQIPTQ
jgi:hypothetical protein